MRKNRAFLRWYLGWYARHRRQIHGNPAPIDPHHPHAPKSHPLPKRKKPLPEVGDAAKIINRCHESLGFAGKMIYTENWLLRQLFFRRRPGRFNKAKADCSQFCATILHWIGIKAVSPTDFTGSLLEKGKLLDGPKPGCVAIWGPGTGAHAAFVTEKVPGSSKRYAGDWYVVGFGHQGAPDRNTLSGMNAYFQSVGEPGVRFLDFTAR